MLVLAIQRYSTGLRALGRTPDYFWQPEQIEQKCSLMNKDHAIIYNRQRSDHIGTIGSQEVDKRWLVGQIVVGSLKKPESSIKSTNEPTNLP
jgi:hypothetical protein